MLPISCTGLFAGKSDRRPLASTGLYVSVGAELAREYGVSGAGDVLDALALSRLKPVHRVAVRHCFFAVDAGLFPTGLSGRSYLFSGFFCPVFATCARCCL